MGDERELNAEHINEPVIISRNKNNPLHYYGLRLWAGSFVLANPPPPLKVYSNDKRGGLKVVSIHWFLFKLSSLRFSHKSMQTAEPFLREA